MVLVTIQWLLENKAIRAYIYASPFVENKARAAIVEKNLAWVRAMKTEIFHLGSWERRAVLECRQSLAGGRKKTLVKADDWQLSNFA
jgi:hypothetical protein